jgi:very-short-patch-repair endonuclease
MQYSLPDLKCPNIPKLSNLLVKCARILPPQEDILWSWLRNRGLNGHKIIRQHPIVYYSTTRECFCFIPDFYCAKAKAIIELDGAIHHYQKESDSDRDAILREMGYKILRIRNEELKEIETTLEKIFRFLEK